MTALPPEDQRQYAAWIAANAVERWGLNPSPLTLAAMRASVAALAPWLAQDEDVTP